MKIIVNAFEAKDQEQVRIVIEDVINQLATNFDNKLNLNNLEYVIVPEDFENELIKFQQEHGLSEGYTNDEYGRAFGKNMCYEKEGSLRTSIFIDHTLAYGLFSEEKSLQQMSLHLIHHELCHTHDDSMKTDMLGLEFSLRSKGDFQTALRRHADNMWSEYIANRWASSTKPDDHDMSVFFLLEMINKIKESNTKYIVAYRHHGDIDQLFGEIQLYTSKLFYTATTVCGYIHGLKLENHEIKKLLDEKVNETYFGELWLDMENELRHLYNIYGSWIGINQLDRLSQIVLCMWRKMGIYPRILDNGALYIDVPWEN